MGVAGNDENVFRRDAARLADGGDQHVVVIDVKTEGVEGDDGRPHLVFLQDQHPREEVVIDASAEIHRADQPEIRLRGRDDCLGGAGLQT